ncbi:hypothetical protein F7725_001673, partial [Dissostichus mawsoni]
MAGVRMYWETDTVPPVSDVMARNRFQYLLTSLHFVNNLTVGEELEEKREKEALTSEWRPTTTSVLSNGMTAERSHLSHPLLDHTCAEHSTLGQSQQNLLPHEVRCWYVYIFWHTIILAVINAWLLYKGVQALKMPKQEILNRRQFQADLASSLIL